MNLNSQLLTQFFFFFFYIHTSYLCISKYSYVAQQLTNKLIKLTGMNSISFTLQVIYYHWLNWINLTTALSNLGSERTLLVRLPSWSSSFNIENKLYVPYRKSTNYLIFFKELLEIFNFYKYLIICSILFSNAI